jgi:hypothetical protein
MKRISKQCSVLATAGLLSVSATLAGAQTIPPHDAKVYHSSECQSQTALDASSLVYSESGLKNDGGADALVICPIVRDNTTNLNGIMDVRIYISNVSGNQFSCKLYSYDTHRTLIAQSMVSTTAGGSRTLTTYANSSRAAGHYSIGCNLPPGGRLHAYQVKEMLNGTNRTDYLN